MDPATALNVALAGRYTLEREIGRGGMATVYLARDIRHERDVALKVLNPELGVVLGGERFLSEIRVTANLQHPNLLPLFDSGEANGLLFYVMPFVEGETLRARLDREKQLPIDDAVRITTAIASALAYAHEHGVIHRDLKPENILIQAGQPVIADFGIALAVSKAGGARVTQTGLSLGTPQYMSPEQAAGDRAIDGRSDIYSLGAVAYEMIAGEAPHSGTSAQAIIAKLMTQDPQSLRALRPSVPGNVADAVQKALAKVPADRFSSAKEFADALTNPTFTLATTSVAVGGGKAHARLRGLLYGTSALAALLLAIACWSFLRPAPVKQVVRYNLVLDSAEALSQNVPFSRIALSPDGKWLAYIGGARAQLMVRARDQLHATPMGGTENASAPTFSPDNEHIAFFVGGVLKIVSVNGGAPLTVTDSLVGPAGASWGRDGVIYTDGAGLTSLVRVAARQGAVPRRFTALDTERGEIDHIFPFALPDAKGVLFTIRYRTGRSALGVADIATGTHRVVAEDVCCAAYAPGGHLVYVSSAGALTVVPFEMRGARITGDPAVVSEGLYNRGSILSVNLTVSPMGTLAYATHATHQVEPVWVTRDGKTQLVDVALQGEFRSPALSPDGTQLALAVSTDAVVDIWVKQLDTGPRVRLTFDEGFKRAPSWTADGRSVTFASNVSGSFSLWTKRADGSAPQVLQLHQSRNMVESLWSPDGAWLIYRTGTGTVGGGDILAIRPGKDTLPVPLVTTSFSEFTPAVSPDGRWLAYSSNETGVREVYVVPFPNSGTGKWAVSTHGGSEPLWSHHSGELFYRDGAGNMMAVVVKTTPVFSVGRATTLFNASGFGANPEHQEYAVAPDDRRFLMLRPKGLGGTEQLVIVDNWVEELKRKSKR
jgi:serine/threonine-protein kinase